MDRAWYGTECIHALEHAARHIVEGRSGYGNTTIVSMSAKLDQTLTLTPTLRHYHAGSSERPWFGRCD